MLLSEQCEVFLKPTQSLSFGIALFLSRLGVQACFRGLADVIVQTAPGVSGCREGEETTGKRRTSAKN